MITSEMEVNIVTKLNALREISKLKFANILNSIPGEKNLTIEPNLIRPLEKICGVKWLRLQNVNKIYKLENKPPVPSKTTHVYLISSNLILFKRVIDQIQELLNKDDTVKYHVVLVPKVLVSFEILLEESGLYDIITLHSFSWEMIEVDTGIFSLEIPNLFGEIYVNGDLSLLSSIGYALRTLFCITGRPNITISAGTFATNVLYHLDKFTDNLGVPLKENSDFEVFIIVDRSIDFISTLLTSVTYSGLLSDTFKIKCGVVEKKDTENKISEDQTGNNKNSESKVFFNIDSVNDTVYANIKDRHISEVSDILSNQARQLKSESEASRDMALSEIKNYVQTKLQKVTAKSKYLSCHLQACEKIIDTLGTKFEKLQFTEQSCIDNSNKSTNLKTIEDMILMDSNYIGLKLMCLTSLTQNLTLEEYNNLKSQYLHQAGYNYLYLFDNLLNCGLMQQPVKSKLPNFNINLTVNNRKDFYTISNKLKLIPQNPDQINVRDPVCPSYVFGGRYIPLLAQLVMLLTQTQQENDIKKKLEIISGTIVTTGITKPFPLQRRSIFLCVIGGLTYAEVTALNLVEKLCNCKIIVSSNCMTSGNDLIESCK